MVYQYRQASSQGRLNARPGRPGAEPIAVGLHPLGLGSPRDGLLYVPEDYRRNHPVPLVLLFHGAGGSARGSLDVFLPSLKPSGCLFLAPDSRATTWDLIEEGGYASDAAFLDRALAHIFQRFTIDETHLAIGGFSDGASYALSLGLTNGDFFTHLVGFSRASCLRLVYAENRAFTSHMVSMMLFCQLNAVVVRLFHASFKSTMTCITENLMALTQ